MKTIIKKFIRKSFKLLNLPIKGTYWYKSNYDDVVKMKNWNIFNLDLVTLGSSAVKYDLDYYDFKINAANWAIAPQNTLNSFAILKNYHSFIKEGGCVLLFLCPFQGMVIDYDKKYYDRYHYFLHPILIKHFNEQTLRKIRKMIENPLCGTTNLSMKAIVKKILGKDLPRYLDAKEDAQNRINGWKKEFGIENLTDTLSRKNLMALKFNTDLLCEIVEFCKERSLKPVFGIVPATTILKNCITDDFMQKIFYNMIEEVQKRTEVQFMDFYRSTEFETEDLYLDSFLMNKKGRKLFTTRILNDLQCL